MMRQTHMLVEVFELNQRKGRIDMTEEDNGIIECGCSMASEELMLQSQLLPCLILPRFPNLVTYASAHQLVHHKISASIPAVLLKASSAYGYIAPTMIDITVSHHTSVDYDISLMLRYCIG